MYQPIEKINLSERVYGRIRLALMDGQYQPGERLRISQLASEFAVSITPVREAIFRLVSEQALEMKAATAIYVPEMTVEQLKEIQLIRHLLEGEAAALAAERITPAELDALEELQQRFLEVFVSDAKKASMLNWEFHFRLISAARMPVMLKTLENMWVSMGPILRTFHIEVPQRDLDLETHKHHEIIQALRARDPNKAKAALQADISWGSILIEWLENRERCREAEAGMLS